MAQQQIERVDPAPRSLTGAFQGRVKNPSSDRVYLLANPNDDACGLSAMLDEGWQPLIWGKCNEKVTGAKEGPNSFVVVKGQVVLWRPKADQDAYLAQKHGVADAIDADARAQTTEWIGDKPTGK